MKTITVLYSCTLCGLVKVPVEVPVRQTDDDLMRWMKDLGIFLSEDHQSRSPSCHPTSLQDVMIPVENARWVGDG